MASGFGTASRSRKMRTAGLALVTAMGLGQSGCGEEAGTDNVGGNAGAESGSATGLGGAGVGTHPGVGGTSPGVGGLNPGVGGTHPGVGGANPGTGGTNPGVGGTIPGVGGTVPGVGGANPGVGGAIPGTGGANPGIGGANPGIGGANPGTGGDPGTGGANPGVGGTIPGVGGVNPGVGGADPGTGGADPGTGGYSGAGATGGSGTAGSAGAGTGSSHPRLCILPLGDSITQSDSSHVSYRYWFWEELMLAGYEFDLVGSLDENHQGVPTYPDASFDRDHEGHWGWRTDEILAQLPGWLGTYTPDVVLLHLGTNDAFQSNSTSSTIDELSDVVGLLRSANAHVVVLLAKVIPTTWDGGRQERLDDLNVNIDALAGSLSTTESPVVVVDQASGFDAGNDTFDGVHPNETGEKKMAAKWFTALEANWPTSSVCAQ